MIEWLDDMPDGTIGFRAVGKLTREDYTDEMIPRLRTALATGDMRVVCALGPDFHGLEPSAMLEDVKSGWELAVGQRASWKRMALVTDLDWIRNAVHVLGWLAPGELRLFGYGDLQAAKAWVAG
jgi:SpoIIAA-like